MDAKIAVFGNYICRTDPSTTSVTVRVLEKTNGLWNESDKFYVNMPAGAGVAAARKALELLLDRLDGCRIAAGPGMTGILFSALDRRGFSVFETADVGPDTLDGILSDLEESSASTACEVPKKPVETDIPGVFTLDLLRLQEAFPEVTSKQALREFLDTTPFYELRLVCSHVPPWLEAGPYQIDREYKGGVIIATVRKKQCGI